MHAVTTIHGGGKRELPVCTACSNITVSLVRSVTKTRGHCGEQWEIRENKKGRERKKNRKKESDRKVEMEREREEEIKEEKGRKKDDIYKERLSVTWCKVDTVLA